MAQPPAEPPIAAVVMGTAFALLHIDRAVLARVFRRFRGANMRDTAASVWSIVLAGGEGERMRAFIERWLERHEPKQYCTFIGTRSLLQHTVDRADRISPAARRITVVARHHREWATAQMSGRGGRLLFQPANRGTAAGVFLPLSRVRAVDPHATVVIYPADHFVWPEARFEQRIREAIDACQASPDRPLLLGVAPGGPEGDYGWIVPDPAEVVAAVPTPSVQRFQEKPSIADATDLMARGGLWNTLVMVGHVETLWRLGRRYLGDLIERFEPAGALIGTRHEAATLDALYEDLPALDFSRDFLQHSATAWRAFELCDVRWSDWGRPERLIETLLAIGGSPAFCKPQPAAGVSAAAAAQQCLALLASSLVSV